MLRAIATRRYHIATIFALHWQEFDVAYHHLVLTTPWQLRMVILLNRWYGLNLLARSASNAVQQWATDVKGMTMGNNWGNGIMR